MPPPRNSHSARCLGVAFRSLGNHARGTETLRPSARTTLSMSSVHDTSTAVTPLISTKVSTHLPASCPCLFPGHFHGEEMLEDFARRIIAGFRLGTADEEIEMLHRRVDLPRMGMLVGHGIRGFERLPVADSLHQHE